MSDQLWLGSGVSDGDICFANSDVHVLIEESCGGQGLYTEKLVYLPNSYFVNDHRQLYPRPFEHTPTYAWPCTTACAFTSNGEMRKTRLAPSLVVLCSVSIVDALKDWLWVGGKHKICLGTRR